MEILDSNVTEMSAGSFVDFMSIGCRLCLWYKRISRAGWECNSIKDFWWPHKLWELAFSLMGTTWLNSHASVWKCRASFDIAEGYQTYHVKLFLFLLKEPLALCYSQSSLVANEICHSGKWVFSLAKWTWKVHFIAKHIFGLYSFK